jgi:membrane protein DedA with SNARE-associated domain/rhodanese-related sulfurtransferase
VLVQQLGAPVPVWPLLVLAGAHAVAQPLFGFHALALAVVASWLGSLPWLWAGRRYGRSVLRLTCRISLSPDACVRQTESLFERHGVAALLVSKFVPGLGHVAPPLAGTFRLAAWRFLLWFGAGSALGALAPLALGALFHAHIEMLVSWLATFGAHALAGVIALLALYVAYRWLVRIRFLRALRGARIDVAELKAMIARGESPIVLDVRSRSHRKLDARMIPGARAVDAEDLGAALAQITPGREVVVYCACPNEATAVKVAMLLRRRGVGQVRPLAGGFDAWFAAGLVTTRPGGDLV